VRLKPGIEWQRVDDEIVALDLNTSAYLGVNDAGALLWPLVVAGTTEDELVEALLSEFAVDGERARVDVGAFVERLRSLSLITENG
jgi:hypothetical protein